MWIYFYLKYILFYYYSGEKDGHFECETFFSMKQDFINVVINTYFVKFVFQNS